MNTIVAKKAGILGPFDRTDPLLAEESSSRSLPFVKITTNLDDSSLLTFVNLRSAEHSGNYTCVAENAAGKAEYTARISVKGIRTALVPRSMGRDKLTRSFVAPNFGVLMSFGCKYDNV